MSPLTRSSSFPRVDAGKGALLGDGFVSDSVLEDWKRSGVATVEGAQMTLSDGRRFALVDGLRILGRRNGDSDPYGLTGRVLSLRSVLRRGGMLSHDGVRLGAAIYDAGFGVIAEPLEGEARASQPPPTVRP